jgi:23S rRNA (uracil1939-C5)-methyltransferase
METAAVKKGTELNLEIESLAFGGRGIAKVNGLIVFVDDALPGQRVSAKIIRNKKGYAEARLLTVLKESAEAVPPRCPYFGECGGCLWQHLDYHAQLKYKHQQVIESLEHIGGFEKPPVLDTLSSPQQFYYRNKMEYSFGDQRWLSRNEIANHAISRPKNFALGLHARGRFDKILDIDECYLQSPRSVEILNAVRRLVLASGMPPYSTQGHSGFWRHLVIREGKHTGEVMINLVTADASDGYEKVDEIAAQLKDKFPDVTTIVHSINRRKAQVAIGEEVRVLLGAGSIKEQIGRCIFQISANSFFQTNPEGAQLLYDKVIEFANFKGDETVYDLYCGAGTIALYISDKVKRVVGFEMIEGALRDAQRNGELNGIENCVFVLGDLKESLSAKWGPPDAMIIDPPRAGMHSQVRQQVVKLYPKKIVYVSCNPTTFARDAKELCRSNYELKVVQPVDMFPMTGHIELVGLLIKADL